MFATVAPIFAILAVATTVAAPAASAAAVPSPGPSGSPLYLYQFIVPKPAATGTDPVIEEIDLNDQHLQPHGHIAMRVYTSDDVVSVTAGSHGKAGELTQIAPGEFVAENSLPGVPFIAHGMHIKLVFTARTADGKTAVVDVPVILG